MPTEREIDLYYFDVWEVCQMLGRPHPSTVTKLIRTGKVEAVKYRQKWMIAPDQVGVLRGLIPHSSFFQKKEPETETSQRRKKRQERKSPPEKQCLFPPPTSEGFLQPRLVWAVKPHYLDFDGRHFQAYLGLLTYPCV